MCSEHRDRADPLHTERSLRRVRLCDNLGNIETQLLWGEKKRFCVLNWSFLLAFDGKLY